MSNAIPVTVRRENANDDYVILADWLKEDRTAVKENDSIAVVESMKTTYEIAAPTDGWIVQAGAIGDRIEIGGVVCYVADSPDFAPAATVSSERSMASATDSRTVFTRKAEQLIEEHGLDRGDFESLKVVKEADVRERLRHGKEPASRNPAEPTPGPAGDNKDMSMERVPSTKQFEVDLLSRSARSVVYSSVTRSVPFAPVKARVDALAKKLGAVSLGECVMRACASALAEDPTFNAYFEDGYICRFSRVNLAFAINVNQGGLKTPVIHDADRLDQAALSKSVKTLALKYLRRELAREDLSDASFTVTDLSSMGVSHFSPVLNLRQGAILGICAPPPETNWFNLVLAFDHRIADGMDAARFLKALEGKLLEP